MLFQDFAPACLIDFKPYCEVFLRVRKCHLYVPTWYHVDELAKAYQKTHENMMGKVY